jgi:hypothetical protein
MRFWLSALVVFTVLTGAALALEDKKTDDLKPADPDTGEITVQEATLGVLPNPLQRWGIIAAEIQTRYDIEGGPVPEHVKDFFCSHVTWSRQPALGPSDANNRPTASGGGIGERAKTCRNFEGGPETQKIAARSNARR